MATAAPYLPQNFDIGRVFGMTFGVIGRNAGLYFGIGFLISGLPDFLFQYFVMQSMPAPQAGGLAAMATFGQKMQYVGVFSLVMVLFRFALQAALSRAAIEDLSGRRPELGECLRIAIAVLPQAIGILILTMLAIMVGMILLIVPGIILALGWAVVIPVLVQERLGVTGSMSRSWELTKGSRWRLLGLLLILCIAIWILQALLVFVATMIFSMAGAGLAVAIGAAVTSTVSAALITAAVAASYVELRQVREGTGVDELAKIFA